MNAFTESFLLLFVLLNPFIMSVYLIDLVRKLELPVFSRQLTRAALISLGVFVVFALTGGDVLEHVLQIRFTSFRIFGGITFLVVGIRLILGIGPAIESPSSHADQVSASIAMPFMVGPGTLSASVLAGTRLDPIEASAAISLALGVALFAILAFKRLHDYVRVHNERLVHRYVEVVGRMTALFTGAFAVEMILKGFEEWLGGF